jgi:hypothetical protein
MMFIMLLIRETLCRPAGPESNELGYEDVKDSLLVRGCEKKELFNCSKAPFLFS